MQKAINSLIDYLQGTKEAWKPSITAFSELNPDQLAKDLKLEEKATLRNEMGGASLDEYGSDANERQILDELRGRARLAHDEFRSALDIYDSRLRQAAISKEAFVRIEAAGTSGLTNFKAQTVEDQLPLRSAKEKVEATKRQYDKFVQVNGLQDVVPFIPTKNEVTGGWLTVGALMLVESAVNGMFFAEGSEFGFVGGVSEAIFLSLLNMTCAAFIAFICLRYVRHKRYYWKLPALFLLVAAAIGDVALNILIAHYREAFSIAHGQSIHFNSVLDSFTGHPFELDEPKSWLLGIVGMILSVVAISKFYKLQDPYPGFTGVAKLKDEAFINLVNTLGRCIGTLTDHRDEAINDMEQVISIVSGKRHDFELALKGRDRLHTQFKEYLNGLEEIATSLVHRYRSRLNETVLAIQPNVPTLSLERPPAPETGFLDDAKAHTKAIDTMSSFIKIIGEQYGVAIDALKVSTTF